jgi:predicted amidohydrolase YtcJ
MPAADLLLRNLCLPGRSGRHAIAVSGDRMVWLGEDRDAAAHHGPTTRLIDAAGAVAVPGLVDTHIHLQSGARVMAQLRLEAAIDITDLQQRLAAYAAANPQLDWIVGRGWHYRLFSDGQALDRRLLDQVVPDRPVLLTAFDGHTAWANTTALQRAGILHGAETGSAFSRVMPGIDRLASGELREAPAIDLVRRLIAPPDEAAMRQLLRNAMRYLHTLGLTGIHIMDGQPAQLARYQSLLADDELTLRIQLPLDVDPGCTIEQIDAWAATARTINSPLLRADTAKLYIDGVIESQTALLLADYAGGSAGCGTANYDQAEFEQLISAADRAGLQVAVHAIGDGGVRRTLDAYSRLTQRGLRHRIEHVELLDPADVTRFRAAGVSAAVQPLHVDFALDRQNPWRSLVGPQRLRHGFAWRELIAQGTPLGLGSDWPVAEPDPLRGMQLACTRPRLDHDLPDSGCRDQRLTVTEALAGYTSAAAYLGRREHELGRIAVGYLADIVLLRHDPLRLPPTALAECGVLMTIVGGRVVFTAATA